MENQKQQKISVEVKERKYRKPKKQERKIWAPGSASNISVMWAEQLDSRMASVHATGKLN